MGILGEAGPRFRLPGDDFEARDTVSGPPPAWAAPTASGPLAARLSLPGSKSLTNRELVLASLADGESILRAPLHSRDTTLMIAALRELGIAIDELEGTDTGYGPDLRITPAELGGGVSIDCGLAGTLMRFLPPLASLGLGPITFDGDEGARRRPMRTTIESLRALGVEVGDDARGTLPFTVYGMGRVAGGELAIDASASSQFVSGLLLSAARFENGLTLRHTGETLPSLPHIAMTIDVLARRGVAVENPEPGVWVVPAGPIAGRVVDIEPDLSNAAPFLVAAVVAGGSVTIAGWPAETTQVGDDLRELLTRFGAETTLTDGSLRVDGGTGVAFGRSMPGVHLDLSTGGELAPALVALAALADSPSRITGIGHLRGHETDRLAALAAELNALGGAVTELPDGLAIDPRPLTADPDRPWQSYEDHRMATAGAIIGLAVPGLLVDDIATTSKTLPQFTELWRTLLGDAGSGGIPISGTGATA
ncbi:3-phosphoshikimate 1-carboxyvinyltransferase [Herbiconiux sp. L3-i23]|uniref:3-phosphoshikimate 1-carboxyvinyltransferase n=1 Tax=Herbiconiux sp. L3-i23 TaxID=2905871 RepID=UPI00206FF245|nr:3-phosphoshikimate 1-carboxyvinyltransferase [Herbiconiux sp. L3-i23]BDI23319.1 3-phosphoshikimate 1-carboxyvinyltransferase 1 [Herbiconiux sp. L3-i23]